VKALVIPRTGPPEVLEVQERPDPQPGPGEVLVRVKAAGINYADLMARQGLYQDAPDLPAVVGYEFAGDVESVGAEVDVDLKPGQRVLGGCRFGGYSELVATKADNVVPLPDDWSYEEGAAMPVNYTTAYAGLVRYGNVRPGERVLIHAAAGGVGIAATQIARLVGAGEIYGTASPGKHDAIKGFGVDHAIDYTSKDFAKEVRRIAGQKEPLDLIMDAIGGSSFRKGYGLLRAGGRLVAYGATSVTAGDKRDLKAIAKMLVTTPVFHPLQMMSSSKAVIGLNMLHLWDEFGSLDDYLQPLRKWVDNQEIRPVVAQAFPLEKGADAHRYLQERKNVGKVVLTL
jgi:NADPH:quinone reductase-like Zn-dependent oxidoreductase